MEDIVFGVGSSRSNRLMICSGGVGEGDTCFLGRASMALCSGRRMCVIGRDNGSSGGR